MRILFLHEVDYLRKPIYEFQEFPEQLALRGHEIGVFNFAEQNSFALTGEDVSWEQRIKGRSEPSAELTLFTVKSFLGPTAGRILAFFSAWYLVLRAFRSFKPDVIVCYAVPTFGLQALFVSMLGDVPLLYRALDISHQIRESDLNWLVKKVERVIYRRCDFFSTHNQALLEYASDLAGKELKKSSINLPPIDWDFFSKGTGAQWRARLGISSQEKVIIFVGTFFSFAGLEEALNEASNSELRATLVLVGDGPSGERLRRVAKLGHGSVKPIFTGYVDYAHLPDLLAAADLGLNTFEKGLVTDCALPNKVLQYCASSLPVVSTSLEGLRGLFGDNSGIEWTASPAAAIRAALSLVNDPAKLRNVRLQMRATRHFLETSNAVVQFENCLMKLAGK